MNEWTQFWDMHSGGSQKEKWHYIYIEAPKDKAILIFYNKFGHNPKRITCTCCGEDYSIEEDTIDQLTAFHRNCKFEKNYKEKGRGHYIEEQNDQEKYETLKEHESRHDVLFIRERDIKDEWLKGEVPEQGYIWQD